MSKISPPSETFCNLPWMHIATNASGNFRPCCNSTPGKNFIKDPETGKPYKIIFNPKQNITNTAGLVYFKTTDAVTDQGTKVILKVK